MEQHSADYRTVAVFGSRPDAEHARGLLESDGIVAAVQEGADAPSSGAARAVRLLVPARDLQRARDLLTPTSVREPEEPEPGEPEPPFESPASADRTWTVGWLALLVAAVIAAAAAFVL